MKSEKFSRDGRSERSESSEKFAPMADRIPFAGDRRNGNSPVAVEAEADSESDLDFAFRLQLEEAMAASLALQPSSSSSNSFAGPPIEVIEEAVDSPYYRLYFKGMVERTEEGQVSAIGVALCDPDHDLAILKIQKAMEGEWRSREELDATALIEGLEAVIGLGIKRVIVFFDFRVLLNHVTGKWGVKQRKLANLINQVQLLTKKLERCKMCLLPRSRVKFVFGLARDIIDSQTAKNAELNGNNNFYETCTICLEVTKSSQMFVVDGCSHQFCFSCMKQHVEVKLLHGMLPGCPQDGCKISLDVESSRKFLPSKLLSIMAHRIKEASIPVNERVYCPYPKCSALMSINEIRCPKQESSKKYIADNIGLANCIKCGGAFCIDCKVPWHESMSCYVYKKVRPHQDAKLQSLARQKMWRQCVRCSHMIELAEGCYHMTCRCGCEFCYTCGAEWVNKKATCSCPLWNENYIWYDDNGTDNSDDDDDIDDDDDEDEDEDEEEDYGWEF